jgi:hypothetical protein
MMKPKVQWHESSVYPQEWGDFGHGIHFHDTRQRTHQDLVAFIEGFKWQRNRSAVVKGFHVKANNVTTARVLSTLKRHIERMVANQEAGKDGMISRRIRACVNC